MNKSDSPAAGTPTGPGDELQTEESLTASVSPAIRSDRAGQKRSRGIRLGILSAILVGITGFGILHQKGTTFKPVGVDALCPFGGIETLWSLISGAGLLQRIAVSSVILLAMTVILAVVFRRAFCGYLCPLGAVQEWFGKIGALIWPRKRPEIPAIIDKPARFLKYAILIFFTIWTWQAATLVIRPYDPWVAWMHLTSAEVLAEFGIGLGILVVSLIGSIVYERFFCKYLCPMGGFLGAISRFSLFKVRRNESTCIDCKACDKACPVNVTVSTVDVVQDAECINCNECVNVCPVADTLVVSNSSEWTGATKLSANKMMVLVLIISALTVGGATLAGAFAWTMPSLAPASESGPVLNVEDIKGSMSFYEISQASGLSPEVFKQKYGIKESEMNTKIKDLAGTYGFDVHTDVRAFVAEQMAAAGAAAPATGEGAAGEGSE